MNRNMRTRNQRLAPISPALKAALTFALIDGCAVQASLNQPTLPEAVQVARAPALEASPSAPSRARRPEGPQIQIPRASLPELDKPFLIGMLDPQTGTLRPPTSLTAPSRTRSITEIPCGLSLGPIGGLGADPLSSVAALRRRRALLDSRLACGYAPIDP